MLGPLEIQVMEVVWGSGESSVRDVVEKLDSKLAYTTVMTTLDRLFKKGLTGSPQVGTGFSVLSPSVAARIGNADGPATW